MDFAEVGIKLQAEVDVNFKLTGEVGVGEWCLQCEGSVGVGLVLVDVSLDGSYCGCGSGICFQGVQSAREGGVGSVRCV